ncbi:sigma D regulator [Aestuariirhabdus litorea]|uniref:Sigma D regulator n=1 Tax=Aestuariirhabdus litorea TaxID=2528527 RepID=A0A3P3VJC9_9GAMM|nr:sigma D regulator [Aestuariirhabdus litorea]RRJ82464.1 sigma D regulator [Aestuariirhabdus litorea]RWW92625.1 sigma D regulator [Endozoicomonadaceae bacterium GTF-13]
MLERCKSAKERWGGVSEIIDRWLNERQQLIVLYCDINGIHGFRDADSTPTPVRIQRFCQILLDYTSAGHFEVYEQLAAEAREFNDDAGIRLLERIYPRIEQITQICVAFNDRYDTTEHCEQLASDLPNELSRIGEVLEERFALEDQLIETLHDAHRELVAS